MYTTPSHVLGSPSSQLHIVTSPEESLMVTSVRSTPGADGLTDDRAGSAERHTLTTSVGLYPFSSMRRTAAAKTRSCFAFNCCKCERAACPSSFCPAIADAHHNRAMLTVTIFLIIFPLVLCGHARCVPEMGGDQNACRKTGELLGLLSKRV